MEAYFADKDELLLDELQRWLGTPWRHHCQACRLGADCIGMVYGVLVATGAIQPTTIPPYPRDWHMHNGDELLVDGLRHVPNMIEILDGSLINGDVILYRYGKASSHIGIYHSNGVYHIPLNQRAVRSPFNHERFKDRIRHIFRCMLGDA